MAGKKKKSTTATPLKKNGSRMSRYVSFAMLIVIILVCGFYSLSVIRGFLLPLFFAVLMVVIFRPIHHWMLVRCKGRETLAAGLATGAILLIVLLPFAAVVAFAFHEANQAFDEVERDQITKTISRVRTACYVQKPFAEQLGAIEETLLRLDGMLGEEPSRTDLKQQVEKARLDIDAAIHDFRAKARHVAIDLLAEERLIQAEAGSEETPFMHQLQELRDSLPTTNHDGSPSVKDQKSNRQPERRALTNLLRQHAGVPGSKLLNPALEEENDDDPVARPQRYLQRFVESLQSIDADSPDKVQQLAESQIAYDNLRTALYGGPIWKWVIELANPDTKQLEGWLRSLRGSVTSWLPSITGTATSLITGLLVGLCIMSVAMFYFFLDGPKMIQSFMRLSPLDDRHEAELLEEFDKVSRAVVIATLLSALVQGALGGFGYFMVGLKSVFLLTLLTTVLALVPFVGAAAVWVPCCLWLAFEEQSFFRAGFLALYGFGIVSMADNLIKPWVLKGQSRLHPLLALLSVLGGVQALGPIGILIGPMVVSFLQVLLTMLQREIVSLDAELDRSGDTGPPASS